MQTYTHTSTQLIKYWVNMFQNVCIVRVLDMSFPHSLLHCSLLVVCKCAPSSMVLTLYLKFVSISMALVCRASRLMCWLVSFHCHFLSLVPFACTHDVPLVCCFKTKSRDMFACSFPTFHRTNAILLFITADETKSLVFGIASSQLWFEFNLISLNNELMKENAYSWNYNGTCIADAYRKISQCVPSIQCVSFIYIWWMNMLRFCHCRLSVFRFIFFRSLFQILLKIRFEFKFVNFSDRLQPEISLICDTFNKTLDHRCAKRVYDINNHSLGNDLAMRIACTAN